MNLLDLPRALLRVVTDHPSLESADHANLARTCRDLRAVVSYTTICYAPDAVHGEGKVRQERIVRLAAALRCANAIQVKANQSFTEYDADIVATLCPELFRRVVRLELSYCIVGRSLACVKRLAAVVPEVAVHTFTLDGASDDDVALVPRLRIHTLVCDGSCADVARLLSRIREPLRVAVLTVHLCFNVDGPPDLIHAVRTCGVSADELVLSVKPSMSSSFARRLGAALARLARDALTVLHSCDSGAIASALAAPRTITRITFTPNAISPMGEMLGACLLDAEDAPPLDQLHVSERLAKGPYLAKALALRRVRQCHVF